MRVREHLVGFFAFFEFHFGVFGCIALVAVRVVLHRQFAISLFDFVFAGVFGYTQNFVKVAFSCHGVVAVKCANAALTLVGPWRGARS